MIIQEPVQAAIWHCLNYYDLENATFLAERLYAEVNTEESTFILATCYYRANQIHQAYWLLQNKSPRSPQCRYLLAKCAYHLKKYSEAESALSSVAFVHMKNFEELSKEFGEVACFALQLIAKICSQTERYSVAGEAYKQALKLNPFLWHAFADLCNYGEKLDPNAIFQFPSTDLFNTCQGNNSNAMIIGLSAYSDGGIMGGADSNCRNQGSNYILTTPIDQMVSHGNHISSPINNLNNTMPILRGGNVNLINYSNTSNSTDETPIILNNEGLSCNNFDGSTPLRKQFKYLSTISPTTPSFGILPISPSETSIGLLTNSPTTQTLIEVNQEQKTFGKKLKSHVGSIITRKEGQHQNNKPAVFTQTGNITPRTPNSFNGQNVRRSSRLFSNNNYSVKENNKSPNLNKFAQPRSPPRKTKQRLAKLSISNDLNEKDKKEKVETVTSSDCKVLLNNSLNSANTMAHQIMALRKQSAEGLISLLRELGRSYQYLAEFNCKEAIDGFSSIPKQHYDTSWVKSMIALAHYEQREYESSAAIFKEIHEYEPYRMELMEIYSTSLWHLQREVGLSALAQDLIMQNKNSSITWCVAGNCFSLHKEHETAIKFFKRAIQIDPDFVYSYTLLGHELVITEELDKAMSCFRTAILKDPRHYNAWFGIGTIYSKQERYELAELHYQHALRINPKNSVLLVHIGAMQFFMQKSEQALETLNAAILLDPRNPLCKFHRGSMYYSLGKHQEALKELEELKQIVPKESVVFYLIGKIHKILGNVDSALMHFSWATDLDPKGANNQLKDAFDSINHAPTSDMHVETDGEPISERSYGSQAQRSHNDPNYDSDSY